MFGERGREFNSEVQRLGGMVHTETCWKLDGSRHLFEEDERPRRVSRDGIVASVQAFR
jgi:hypothetical protein